MNDRCYRIGELAKLVGVSQRTIDYYTRLGLICPMQRTGGNYRIYDESTARRLRSIKARQAQRISLAEIAVELEIGSVDVAPDIVVTVRAIGRDLAEAQRQLALVGTTAAIAGLNEDLRRTIAKIAGEALLHSLTLAQYLAALAGP
ncbi:MAG: MerR family transcriptional regulator [Dehalococcoidia bacterium]|nr:MerR family transcriptional regulator [Dehalococcoidia bacterium]